MSATERDEDGPQVMPEPWFRANQYARHLSVGFRTTPARQVAVGERTLGAFILPPFQRAPVWSEVQKVRLVESLWADLPVGAYIVNRTYQAKGRTDGWLLDGQQRWGAILDYVAGKFPVHGRRYTDLSASERRRFDHKTIPELETSLRDPAACQELYDRLAYGGTPHSPPSADAVPADVFVERMARELSAVHVVTEGGIEDYSWEETDDTWKAAFRVKASRLYEAGRRDVRSHEYDAPRSPAMSP